MRQAVGPTIAGLGAWFALGDLTTASPDSSMVRLAVPAAWYWLPLAIGSAGLVSPWRHRPILATPALLPAIAWLPLPMPAIAMLWTGPMAWVPVIVAILAAWSRSAPAGGAGPLIDNLSPRRSAIAAGVVTLLAVIGAATALAPRLPGGDEPHYLIITQSLLGDGDLRIENNHQGRDYAAYFVGELRPHFTQRGQDGEVYSIHAPGASVLVLPAFALFGYRGAQATILLLAALAGAMLWQAGWLITRDRRAAWFGALAVVVTPTFLIQGVTIFPDGPGAFVVAAGLLLIVRLGRPDPQVRTVSLVGGSALIASLPWLHTRFSVLAAGLGVAVAWLLLTDEHRSVRDRWRRVVAFFFVPALSAAGWLWFFHAIYGAPNPTAPYGAERNTSLAFVPGGLTALFADAQFGLLVYSPVLLAVVVGLLANSPARERRLAVVAVGIGVANMAAAATYWMWWAGVPAPPARFAAASLPVFAVPLALAWRHASQASRAVWRTLLVLSLIATALLMFVGRGSLAWNVRGVRAAWLDWLNGLADLSRGWPSFFWQLTPTDLSTQLHFAVHVLVWSGLVAGAAVAFGYLRRGGRAGVASDALAAAWCVLLLIMLTVQAGWWINGESGLNAARSQLVVLGRMALGQGAFEIGPWFVAARRGVYEDLRIRATRADRVGEPGAAWPPLLDVPPGRYAVRTTSRSPGRGAVTLRLGRSAAPLVIQPLDALTDQTFQLPLVAGAAALLIEPDEVFASVGETVEISPLAFGPSAGDRATAQGRYGDVEVFFMENTSVFVDADGFWVRGGHTARFAIAPPAGTPSVLLELSNGAAPNHVTVAIEGTIESVNLDAWESRSRRVPVAPDGVVRLRVTSPSGFRPSEVGPSQDGRYFGVRVTTGP